MADVITTLVHFGLTNENSHITTSRRDGLKKLLRGYVACPGRKLPESYWELSNFAGVSTIEVGGLLKKG